MSCKVTDAKFAFKFDSDQIEMLAKNGFDKTIGKFKQVLRCAN